MDLGGGLKKYMLTLEKEYPLKMGLSHSSGCEFGRLSHTLEAHGNLTDNDPSLGCIGQMGHL